MNQLTRMLALGTLFGALVACGGGGGSGGNGTAPVNLTKITANNAPRITSAVISAALEGGDLGNFANLGSGGLPSGKTLSSPLMAKVGSIQTDQAVSLLKQSQLGLFQAPINQPPVSCAVTGEYTISGDISGSTGLVNGDTITIDYDLCDDGLTVIDGSFSMTIRDFSGDFVSGAFSFDVDVVVTAFSVTEGGETVEVDGRLSISLDASATPSLSMTVSASSLTVTENGATHTLAAFTLTQSTDSVTGDYTLTVEGTLSSSDFNGSVNFETTVDLQGAGTGFAFVGEITITGDANSTIHVTVLDSTMVRLEVDTDGDGAVDDVIDRLWTQLT
jgi:hypothetical protein